MRVKSSALSLALMFLLALIFPFNAKAVSITPMYANTQRIKCDVSFSSDLATCIIDIAGYSGTTKITATMSLQQQNSNGTYTTIKTWPLETAQSNNLYVTKTYYVEKGCSYRTYVSASVTRNGSTENVTDYSDVAKCN